MNGSHYLCETPKWAPQHDFCMMLYCAFIDITKVGIIIIIFYNSGLRASLCTSQLILESNFIANLRKAQLKFFIFMVNSTIKIEAKLDMNRL